MGGRSVLTVEIEGSGNEVEEAEMIVDCGTCPVAGAACADCAVRVLLDVPLGGLGLDPLERRAVDVFVGAGLVDADTAAGLTAEVQPWEGVQAVAG